MKRLERGLVLVWCSLLAAALVPPLCLLGPLPVEFLLTIAVPHLLASGLLLCQLAPLSATTRLGLGVAALSLLGTYFTTTLWLWPVALFLLTAAFCLLCHEFLDGVGVPQFWSALGYLLVGPILMVAIAAMGWLGILVALVAGVFTLIAGVVRYLQAVWTLLTGIRQRAQVEALAGQSLDLGLQRL